MREKKLTLHFIGIGGIGMSGIARLYLAQGHRVQGSDARPGDILQELETLGAKIFIGHDPAHLAGADVVIYSSSIPEAHPERAAAVAKGLTVMHRAEALAQLCQGKFTVAVAGSHGKTTTTALIGMILKEAGREPSVVVGGIVSSFGGNAFQGSGREMVIEADESDSSFLKFSPDIAVITNIDLEHLDHFKDIQHIENTFRDFLARLTPSGEWFGCAEDPRLRHLAQTVGRAELYGFDNKTAAWTATDIVECPGGERGAAFTAWHGDKKLGAVRLKIIGRHNILNSLAAIAVASKLGVEFAVIAQALGKYEGAGRRFDVQYEDKDFLVVDDYAHHPTEIQKTLQAARALKKNRIVALFQPHRYSRTEFLLKEFGKSFQDADKLFVTDIYAASEAPRPGISGRTLYEEISRVGHPDISYAARTDLLAAVSAEIRPGDLVLVMGAGDIYQVARQLAESLRGPRATGDDLSALRGRVLKNEPMAKHTTLKIGGPAETWVEPADEEDLKNALQIAQKKGMKIALFGAGSNLLPPDEGLKGMALHLGAAYFKQIRLHEGFLIARAGVPNTLFIQFALEHGFGGCEFLLGIPGNIGGAIAMNAGSHGQSIAPIVQNVTTVTFDGQRRVRQAGEIPFTYRRCGLRDELIVEATFKLPKVPKSEVQGRLEEYRQYRAGTQDLRYPSAGCMFKNPEIPGCSSGRLIDEAGLKGLRIGNAQISQKHANFIINLGGATSRDVRDLIDEVRAAVKKKFDITLETEVKILGEDGLSLLKNEKIAVLAGGISCEREVSLRSGRNVLEALESMGIHALWVDAVGDFMEQLKREKVTLAFLALHGTFGEDGTVQRLLEKEGILYTGPGALASELAFDKSRSQEVFKKEGIRVPDFFSYNDISRVPDRSPFGFPVVVKPAKAGSSVGVTIVSKPEDLQPAAREAFRYSDVILVERFIGGRELTVGILGEETLPIVEVVAQREFYDYEAKYGESGTRYEVPAAISPPEAEETRRVALRAHHALGCAMMSRVDLILAKDGGLYVLEVNTIPGLTSKSLLPKAAQKAGIDFPGLCVKILAMALRTQRAVQAHG